MYSEIANPNPGQAYWMELNISPGRAQWFRLENRTNQSIYVAQGQVPDAEGIQRLAFLQIPPWHFGIFRVKLEPGQSPVVSVVGILDPNAPVPADPFSSRWVLRPIEGPAVLSVYRLRW